MNTARTPSLSILVVDDEAVVRESLTQWLREDGLTVQAAANGREALLTLKDAAFDVALIDIRMPGMDGLELQRRILAAAPNTTIIIMTAFASVKTAVQALKEGAYDYITKPFDPDDLSHLLTRIAEKRTLALENQDLDRENRALKTKLAESSGSPPILGSSEVMRRVHEKIEAVAETTTTVLVTGESGVGKELVARAIHARSPRAYMPLVVVNCGALPEGILESELFGHERGAFTGAQYRHKGKFELADGGTLFLDEVGELTLRIQVELLRVLEEKKVVRLGGTESVRADFRLIAATNKDLREEMRASRFREDLFYRLHVFNIFVPPLRERPEDIPLLARAFAERFSRKMDRPTTQFDDSAIRAMRHYPWPGNVRELANMVEQAVVSHPGDIIRAQDLSIAPGSDGDGSEDSPAGLAAVERRHVVRVLEDTHWNISHAARLLDVDRKTVYHKIKQYGLRKDG